MKKAGEKANNRIKGTVYGVSLWNLKNDWKKRGKNSDNKEIQLESMALLSARNSHKKWKSKIRIKQKYV